MPNIFVSGWKRKQTTTKKKQQHPGKEYWGYIGLRILYLASVWLIFLSIYGVSNNEIHAIQIFLVNELFLYFTTTITNKILSFNFHRQHPMLETDFKTGLWEGLVPCFFSLQLFRYVLKKTTTVYQYSKLNFLFTLASFRLVHTAYQLKCPS